MQHIFVKQKEISSKRNSVTCLWLWGQQKNSNRNLHFQTLNFFSILWSGKRTQMRKRKKDIKKVSKSIVRNFFSLKAFVAIHLCCMFIFCQKCFITSKSSSGESYIQKHSPRRRQHFLPKQHPGKTGPMHKARMDPWGQQPARSCSMALA